MSRLGRILRLDADRSYLLLALALTVFGVAPLAYPGYMQVHSGFAPIYNLANLAARDLDVRWAPGVAGPFDPLRGDGLLAYYLALPVLWLGGEPVLGVKIVFAFGLVLGALGMYLWWRPVWGATGAMISALVYTYLPYHIAAIYVRGAYGEALSLGWLPLALGLALIPPGRNRCRRAGLVVLVWMLLGLSQPGLGVWAVILLVAWQLLRSLTRLRSSTHLQDRPTMMLAVTTMAAVGASAAVVLSLAAANWEPSASPVPFQEHFLYPAQLFSPYWGFGASRAGWQDGLALGLGFAALGLTLLTLLLGLYQGQATSAKAGDGPSRPSGRLRVALYPPLIIALVLTCLLFSPTAVVWRLLSLQQLVTCPWQLLGPIGLCLSGVAGAASRLERRLQALPMQAALVLFVLLPSYGWLEPRFTQLEPGAGPVAAWNEYQAVLANYELHVAIPPRAAGLSQATPGWIPVADYGPPQPGDTLHLLLTWQITRPFERDLKMFVHVLDASDQVIAQADPLAGAGAGPGGTDYLTSQWEPGQLIVTAVSVVIPPDAIAPPRRLAIGLYDGETLKRLPVVNNPEGRVLLEVGSTSAG